MAKLWIIKTLMNEICHIVLPVVMLIYTGFLTLTVQAHIYTRVCVRACAHVNMLVQYIVLLKSILAILAQSGIILPFFVGLY